jgi:hypothetical protein
MVESVQELFVRYSGGRKAVKGSYLFLGPLLLLSSQPKAQYDEPLVNMLLERN